MCRFVYVLLFIFAPGNTLLNLRHFTDCGGKILGERSGSIRYLHPNRITNESTEKLLDVTCTWIIDAHKNQTVWIDVISTGKGAIGIQFGNGDTQTYEKEERALFSGTGRTIIEWSLRRTDKPFATLHLRWNTSEDSPNLALIPYTHVDADPVSPSPSGSNDVTYTTDIPASSNAAPKTPTLRGENTRLGGGVSDLADKHRPLFPQEITNNRQETAGAWISDLTLAGTNSYFDTHTNSALDTHMNTLIGSSHEPFLASTEIQSPLLFVQTTPRQATDVATKTSALLATTDVSHTELHRGSSQNTHAFTRIQSKMAKRGHPSSMFPTSSFITASPQNIQPLDKTSKNKDFLRDTVNKAKATTVTVPNKDAFTISENVGTSQFHATITDDDQPIASEMDRTDRSPRSTNQNQTIYDESVLTRSTPATVSKFPNVSQTNPLAFFDSDTTEYSGYSTSPSGISEPPINLTTENEPTTSSEFMHTSRNTLATPTLTSSEESTTHISHTIQSQHNKSTQETSSTSAAMSDLTAHSNNKISAFTTFPTTIPPNLTPTESPNTPEEDEGLSPSGSDCLGLACTSYLTSTVQGEQENPITNPPSISLTSSESPQISPNVTSDLMVEDSTTVRFENRTDVEEPEVSPSQVQNANTKSSMHTEFPNYTVTHPYSNPSSESTQSNVGFSDATDINEMSSGQTVGRSHLSPTPTSATSLKTTLGLSAFNDIHTGSTENTNGFTAHTTITLSTLSSDITASYISQVSTTDRAFQTSIPVSTTSTHWETSQTSAVHPPAITTMQMNPHATSTEMTSGRVHTHIPVPQPSTVRPPQNMTTSNYLIQTKARTISTQAITQTSQIHSTASSFDRKWPHGRHYFIVEDQPAIIKEKTFQVLLQIILEEDYTPSMRLFEVETFLQRLSGFQNQHVTWHSGQVLQTVVQFQTVEALSWLGRVESLLQEAGLNPLPKKGIFVGGVRVKNITVGGLQTDVCEWLFECPSGFQCVSLKGNATCTSVCHSEYCNHQGICVHRLGQQPICQCPVGEDYWFMGQRCDLRMTRPRLVGVCFGVLVAVAAVMALLSYLAVRRFKSKLMQAKVEQTRSSYRRFNHFDELSARFWGRSWPGSEDSLDNPAFTRSDELLHLRALDRTCCYHDDTLSVVSTYHGSGTHLNTIYPHGSQYGWDLSNCSLADGVVDSGKASDLSVCSWPIEPIQWTPFPLLQQLTRNTTTVKASRPRSYCEGMELVDLEKSWTA